MTVGSLGDIVFSVSSSTVKTLDNLKLSGSASYGKHSLHCGDTKIEYVGNDAGAISFTVTLAANLGVDVEGELEKIEAAKTAGKVMRLIIGMSVYGKKWVISKYSVSYKYFDKAQNPMLAEVSISLTEYC